MNKQTISRVKMDCNWIVPQTAAMRKQVQEIMLQGVEGLEARLEVKIKARLMDYNELNNFLKGN